MPRIKVYTPDVQVLLYKNVKRTTAGDGVPLSGRYIGTDRVIDLAPWLSDQSLIRTSKSVREPAGGFSITLADRIHGKDLDSLYGLVEPMDCIEIRMARQPGLARQGNSWKLPIIMRGFVSDIRRAESFTGGGKPQRQVTITGMDYGKLWQIFQIFYEANFPMGAVLISQWHYFLKYGGGFQNMNCRAFEKEAVEKILNPFIERMMVSDEDAATLDSGPVKPRDDTPLQKIKIIDSDLTAVPGTVAPTGVNQYSGGSLYAMMSMFGDVGAWNELFLEDREDGVYLVYRPNPYYSVKGEYIPTLLGNRDAKEPARVSVTSSDIQAINVSRNDNSVANYYWVDAPRSQLVNGSTARAVAAQSDPETFMVTSRNSSQHIYGLRKMFDQTNQGDPESTSHGNGLDKDAHAKEYNLTTGWMDTRRKELVAQNKDNVVFESGSIRIKGREDVKSGMYVDVRRGTMEYSFYVVQVDHEFIPFEGFFTTLTVDRGAGFIKRAQREAGSQSPYYAEISTEAPNV